jgi:FMN-dependent NADH-azoreductase
MSKNILRIDASMRKTGSYSRNLLDKLIKQLNGEKLMNSGLQLILPRLMSALKINIKV